MASEHHGIPTDQLRGWMNKRMPSREHIERVRAAGICAEDEWVEEFAELLLDMRQALRGGDKYPKVRNWGAR